MEISIILVNWNSEEYLKKCIDSFKESVRDISYEIIIVDNNSTGNSALVIKQTFPEVILLKNNANLGFSKANNIGAKIAKR